MTNTPTPPSAPISLPEPDLVKFRTDDGFVEGYSANAIRAIIAADRAHAAASPDVAKMVEHLKGWVKLNVVLGDIQRTLCSQLDALGAAAKQARAAVGAASEEQK
jgi:hypothetical protein